MRVLLNTLSILGIVGFLFADARANEGVWGGFMAKRTLLYGGHGKNVGRDAEALSDEGLEHLFADPSRRSDLIDFHSAMQTNLRSDTAADCSRRSKELAKRWVVLAETEVDIYNLIADRIYLQWAKRSSEMALKCDPSDGRAQRLNRNLH